MLNDEENNIVFKTLKNLKNNKHVVVDVENYSQLKKFSLVIKKLNSSEESKNINFLEVNKTGVFPFSKENLISFKNLFLSKFQRF